MKQRLAPLRRRPSNRDLRDDAEMASQSVAFEQHLELAATKSKNVVIHQRDAWADTLKMLRPYSAHVRGVFHCFNGSLGAGAGSC